MEQDIERFASTSASTSSDVDETDPDARGSDDDFDDESEDDEDDEHYFPNIPVVMPRKKFTGACNVETVKDGAYLNYIRFLWVLTAMQ